MHRKSGEPMGAMKRFPHIHPDVTLEKMMQFFSSKIIPGNENYLNYIMN